MGVSRLRGRTRIVAVAAAAVTAAGIGTAVAETAGPPPSNAASTGMGVSEFGMTKAFFDGKATSFTYSNGFYCDTSVSAQSTSGCEVGATYHHPPTNKAFDPLFITVPLFKNQTMRMECPNGKVCVDHPGTIDLSRLAPALGAPASALYNAPTPGHEHFITTANNGKAEWWDVKVIGVTKKKVFNQINQHRSYSYIQQLRANHNPHVTANIPTNLFLWFGVKAS
jgi:hypothetical protein